ncbi:helix-turn-helix transcriptional regulator [Nocardioides soli]|uniref:Transcriptional regulator with XRE-family HTH domain n=1 Tax=Nocardioides soli TaxID=1036020 RepID=A0A7W4VST4_9ACTN|nr:helix-turn-helix transcriptional regulator [Nocardioides soli]MBB3041140.1 transcriptional regulator with XRE-family HTH domain [Nocardioides soli]
MTSDKEVGERIRALRMERGLTQTELAERLTDLGLPMQQQTILKIEKGTRALKLNEGMTVATALSQTLESLIPESLERRAVSGLRSLAAQIRRRTMSAVDMLIDAELDARELSKHLEALPQQIQDLIPGHIRDVAGLSAEELFAMDILAAREHEAKLEARDREALARERDEDTDRG